MEEVKKAVEACLQELFGLESPVVLTRPDPQFGDFATNIAMQITKQVEKNPREIAEALSTHLKEKGYEASVAGPGFLNIRISDTSLKSALESATQIPQAQAGKNVIVEYSDPNPFKELHVGHLYDGVVGDTIANVYEAAGATVHRVNFGGDVGLHVGKTLWAIIEKLGGEHPEKLAEVPEAERSKWLAEAYVEGTNAYEDNPDAKQRIIDYNQQVYKVHEQNDHESPFAQIYWTCRGWSYDYFNAFYDRVGVHFEKYYPESITAPTGLKTVQEQLTQGVFEQSDGAIVFKGEPYGLHTRVFINSKGLPTYEAKDIGLALCKWEEYHFDSNIIITGNDIVEYMKVVLKALEQFVPEIPKRTIHLTHGMVKLAGGTKMSSRKGNILRAVDVIDMTTEAMSAAGKADEKVVLGAIKYAFLKSRIGGDIIYSPEDSVSIEGNSGPYLQYAYARACSIMKKAEGRTGEQGSDFTEFERSLAAKISEFPEVIGVVLNENMPHHICTYLYELTQVFNRFYENEHVIGDAREAQRLALLGTYREVLRQGLSLLGMNAPESM